MAYRRAGNLLPRGMGYVCIFSKAPLEKGLNVNRQTGGFHRCLQKQSVRTLHTGLSMMVARLLSVDELFAKRSLQGYLKKMEMEYRECLKAVNGTEECCSEEELRATRTRVSLLTPLIRTVRELEAKQMEMAETEALLEGEAPSTSWQGIVFCKLKEGNNNSEGLQFILQYCTNYVELTVCFCSSSKMKTRPCVSWQRQKEKTV